MAEPKSTPVGRLAMRHEGEFWNAYYATAESMNGAILLGSIKIAAVTSQYPARKEAFMQMMASIVSDVIADVVGVKPTWGEVEDAPEHERAGNG